MFKREQELLSAKINPDSEAYLIAYNELLKKGIKEGLLS